MHAMMLQKNKTPMTATQTPVITFVWLEGEALESSVPEASFESEDNLPLDWTVFLSTRTFDSWVRLRVVWGDEDERLPLPGGMQVAPTSSFRRKIQKERKERVPFLHRCKNIMLKVITFSVLKLEYM